jgi:hypothetical protein
MRRSWGWWEPSTREKNVSNEKTCTVQKWEAMVDAGGNGNRQ